MRFSSRLAFPSAAVLALSVLGVVPPFVGAVSAAEEMCQGQAATIVGDGPTVTGTPGPDVIVSAGAIRVDAGAGDDLVCLTPGATERIVLHGDAGDDSILVEDGVVQEVRAELGAGADTYVGGDNRDIVTSTAGPSVRAAGFGPDNVDTGAGDDVFVAYAPAGAVDLGDGQDRVDLYEGDSGRPVRTGTGNDLVEFHAATDAVVGPTATIDAGPGINRLDLANSASVDLRKQTLTLGSSTAPLLGIQDVFLHGESSTFIGDGSRNSVQVYTCASRIKGGRGNDRFTKQRGEIESGLLDCSGAEKTHRWFGNQGSDVLSGSDTEVDEFFGGPGDDQIAGLGQTNTISGGGGDDFIAGGPGRDLVFGGNGDDLLLGKRSNDKLFGGAGRDKAKGGPGRDTCDAEILRTCER